jgi:ribosome-associated translation inhibitor RaiA
MSDTWDGSTQVLEERLRLGAGFGAADRRHVLDLLSSLTRHLARWKPGQVDLEISVKDRGGPEQKVTIEALLPGLAVVVATSSDRELDHAVIGARKELIRQIDDEKAKRSDHKGQRHPSHDRDVF